MPFMEKAGFKPRCDYDFVLKGVTSMSLDTHKYGFTAKGISAILYSNLELRGYQYTPVPDWTGGIYATPCVAGSRQGSSAAVCWSAMVYMGLDGYVAATREIVTAARKIEHQILTDPELNADLVRLGKCDTTVVCFAANPNAPKEPNRPINVYGLAKCMSEVFKWNLNSLQNPASVHLCVTLPVSKMDQEFIKDLKAAVKMCREDSKWNQEGAAGVYGTTASVPASVAGDLTKVYLDACAVAYKRTTSSGGG